MTYLSARSAEENATTSPVGGVGYVYVGSAGRLTAIVCVAGTGATLAEYNIQKESAHTKWDGRSGGWSHAGLQHPEGVDAHLFRLSAEGAKATFDCA